jgi:hypothetical protein
VVIKDPSETKVSKVLQVLRDQLLMEVIQETLVHHLRVQRVHKEIQIKDLKV